MKKYLLVSLAVIAVLLLYLKTQGRENRRSDNYEDPETTADISNEEISGENSRAAQNRNMTKHAGSDIYSGTETGDILKNISESYEYLDSPSTDKGRELFRQIRQLKSEPEQTFREISATIDKIPAGQENLRQFFIQLTSGLDVEKREKLSFLENQLLRSLQNVNTENEQTYFTPSIIMDTYTRTSSNQDQAEKVILKAIPLAPSIIQKRLINSFTQSFPDRAKELFGNNQ
ncbi:MAG: hypothetical protein JXA66_04570 [Oligoflexia bacterium]|nr:hypothetical protein [Oligoflexia bacterium]